MPKFTDAVSSQILFLSKYIFNNKIIVLFSDLAGNNIGTVHGKPFEGLISLQDLLLSYNEIETLPFDSFVGLNNIQLLDLEGNKINFIHKDTFKNFKEIKDL